MTFGSWFGGLWMLKLDASNGLRDYSTTYETVKDQTDQYYGIKIAGGHGNSGEGSYIMKQGDYWYLFVSYAALQQTGGYQIREFRSKDITGPMWTRTATPQSPPQPSAATGLAKSAYVSWHPWNGAATTTPTSRLHRGTTPHSWMKTALLCGLPHPLLQPRRRARSTCS